MLRFQKPKTTHKQRILALLKDRRYHSSREMMNAGGFRYGARLLDLRKDGYTFAVKPDEKKPNSFLYRLISRPKFA
jgi:hypothetical protein